MPAEMTTERTDEEWDRLIANAPAMAELLRHIRRWMHGDLGAWGAIVGKIDAVLAKIDTEAK